MHKESILVINCGSSSLKFSLICMSTKETIISGLAECLGTADARTSIKFSDGKVTAPVAHPFDHDAAIQDILKQLKDKQLTDELIAVGHRVVHGGELYSEPTLINEDVIYKIGELSALAPLHNPANVVGIRSTQKAFPSLPQVAVFDTAFHQSMPEKAFLYAIPYKLYEKHALRRYGFHGTSHYFVSTIAAQLLRKPLEETNLITAHLGNGCSITAVKNGQSVDTSMGLTPLEGVMMGTRSGDIDPGLIMHLANVFKYPISEINDILNKEGGLKGLSELSNDCRLLQEAAIEEKNPKAILALEVFCYRIAKTIASYTAALTDLDALVFTGGIGENSAYVREKVIGQLKLIGAELDPAKNEQILFGHSGNIATANSRPCLVIPTNEEWVIASQTKDIIEA